ncbi:MAG: hypothetical protein AMXMBFR84_34090 [Candidatus Hydrogenedentota bacterium]
MFSSIGPLEILVIAGIALVVLGPEKFPTQAKIAMRMFRDIQGYWNEAKRELTEELKPVRKEMDQIKRLRPEEYLDKMIASDEDDAKSNGQNGQTSANGSPGEGSANAAPASGAVNVEVAEGSVPFGTSEDTDIGVQPTGRSTESTWDRKDDSSPLPESAETKNEDYVEKPQRWDD